MKTAAALSVAAILIASQAHASRAPAAAPTWGQWQQPASQAPGRHHRWHHARHHIEPAPVPAPIKVAERRITVLQVQLEQMRRELDEVRYRVSPAPSVWADALRMPPTGIAMASRAPQERVASLPDLRQPEQPPATPAPALPAQTGIEAVDRARAYLVATATPGFTMVRQGPVVAIGRLHPDFAMRLEQAIRQARASGLDHAGIFSAYRPPAFGIGGFSDKYNSLHSYGLAIDATGIGSAGSASARLWQKIVKRVGLFLPYGSSNKAEFNHVQLIETKVALAKMRATITASAPKDLRSMWLASGVKDHVPSVEPISSARLLPDVDWSEPQ